VLANGASLAVGPLIDVALERSPGNLDELGLLDVQDGQPDDLSIRGTRKLLAKLRAIILARWPLAFIIVHQTLRVLGADGVLVQSLRKRDAGRLLVRRVQKRQRLIDVRVQGSLRRAVTLSGRRTFTMPPMRLSRSSRGSSGRR
jgi:hypothetical protein